jgi:hypothetical protein
MHIRLHQNARAAPAIRRELQTSTLPNAVMARRYHVSEETLRKWQARQDARGASHCPQRLQITLTPAKEAVVLALHKTTCLPLDDLLAVVHDVINPAASRSGINRCLLRTRVPTGLAKLHRPTARTATIMAGLPFSEPPASVPQTLRRYLPVSPAGNTTPSCARCASPLNRITGGTIFSENSGGL